MTQFLTKAQGMPHTVVKSLHTIIRNFLWDGKKTPPGMSLNSLMKPIQKGGINLLDLEARNQAIELTWLKSYIDRSHNRPTWTFAVDAIINCINTNGITTPNDIHTFLTTLRPSGRPRRNGKQTPRPLVTLIQTAKKFNLTFAPRKLSKSLKRQMPAWFHIGVPPRLYHKSKTECLRTKHKAVHMRDLVRISRRLNRADSNHEPTEDCKCPPCKKDRRLNCKNPHRCASTARDITGLTEEKYNIAIHPPKDGLTLTHRRMEKNQKAVIEKNDEIIFDPTITTRNSLDECFRVLAENPDALPQPAYRLSNPRREQGQPTNPTVVFTDGSCEKNGKLDAICGSGIWFGENDPRNQAIRTPGQQQSNQIGEIVAIIVALQQTDPTSPLTIISDSRYAIDGLTKHLGTWEDNGWVNIKNAEWLQLAAYHLRRRAAPTSFKWVKGHANNLGNERADDLANQGAHKPHPDEINRDIPENFQLRGVKLTTLTQKIAYDAIRWRQTTPYTRQTLMNLDITRHAIRDITNNLETDESLWNNLRHPDIRRPIQHFLYRAMAGSLRIGDFWNNIPNLEPRAKCTNCVDTIESLEHILTECPSTENSTIWNLVRQTWPDAHANWTAPTIGHILGCGNITPKMNNAGTPTARQRGEARLKRIIISESTYLIWTLRCDRVIGGHHLNKTAITTRWKNAIVNRLDIDRRLANAKRKEYPKKKVENTWSPVVSDLSTLPTDWTTNLEVLVGIKLSRPPE